MRSKLHYNVFALMLMTAVVSSCEKMTLSESAKSENVDKGNVVLRVTQFEQIPFGAQTRAEVGSVCTRLCFHIYDEDGIRVSYVNQKLEESNFGTASFSLGEGRYVLVVVGHSASSNPSFSANEKVSISGNNLGDTFWCCEELEVGEDEIELNLRLKRIVSMLRFIPTDNKPANMNQVIFSYKGSKGTFDGLTGYGSTNTSQTVKLEVDPDADQYEFYMIPSTDNDLLDINLSTYYIEEDGKIHSLTEKEISQVPVKRNCITICRGSLFDDSSSAQSVFITISVDADWDDNINMDF
ncbi:MAG: hypothetical protein J6Q22_13200 [Prevotella sp.]|nr:hypothetical protein [Prevotella sp.]